MPGVPNQEGIMSSLFHAHQKTDLKRTDYTDFYDDKAKRDFIRFILILFCMVLVLVVASVIFTPAPVGSGITSEITTVGP